ncbi:MAG TPA: AtpZ/AtpI family protein [Chryseosolibacter sp.]|nr:AtpZ/AtpI family protein [Chryseosolibacter sp.]
MEPSQEPSRRQSQSNSYLKYTSLAFQLLIVIGVFGWLGHKLDGWLGLQFPVFMLILGFLGFGGMMYQIYRSINQQ